MPSTLIKGWAKKHKLKVSALESLWNRAKAIASKKYSGKSLYKVVVGSILPKMIKKKFGVSVEDTEHIKLYIHNEDVELKNAIQVLRFADDIIVGVFDAPVEGSMPIRLGVSSIAEEIDYLPYCDEAKAKLVIQLENEFGGAFIIKGEKKFTVIHDEDDKTAVQTKLRILAASNVFEDVGRLNLVENFSYTNSSYNAFPNGDIDVKASLFYQGISNEYFSPVVEAFAITAVQSVINEYRVLEPEEINEFRDLMWTNHSSLTKVLAVKMEGVEIPAWYFKQLDNVFQKPFSNERPFEAYDTKVAKLSNLCMRYPKEFDKLVEWYSDADKQTMLKYIKTKPGHKRNAKSSLEFLENIGAVVAHLSDEVMFFVEKIKGRVALFGTPASDVDIDISDF